MKITAHTKFYFIPESYWEPYLLFRLEWHMVGALYRSQERAREMAHDIDAKFIEIKSNFENTPSPDRPESIARKVAELHDLFYGTNPSHHWPVRKYTKDYLLKGKTEVIDKSQLGTRRNWVIETEALYRFFLQLQPPNKFIKPAAELRKNGQKGGTVRGERNYKKFLEFIKDKSVDVSKYADVSPDNFATALNDLGFPISKVTARSYREKYLLIDKKDK